MKLKMMSLIAVVTLLLSCGSTRTTTSTNNAFAVPATVQTSFTTLYPTATNVVWSNYDVVTLPIDWELTGWAALSPTDYTVSFDMDGKKYYSWYDAGGNWIGSAFVVPNNSTLPTAVNTTITSKYPGYTIDKIQKESWKEHIAYEVRLKNGDNKVKLLVDDSGTVLKEKNK